MNIIVYTPDQSASWERCARPWHLLRKRLPSDTQITFVNSNSPVRFQATWDHAGFFDLAFFHRPFHPDVAQGIKAFKRLGVKIWVDYDDLLTAVPETNPAYSLYMNEHTQNAISSMLEDADILTASTQTLLENLDSPAPVKAVVPNGHDFSVFNTPRAFDPNGPKIVMWRGSESHRRDVMEFREPIEKAIKDNPDWKFYFVGMQPSMLKPMPNMRWVKPIERTVFEDGMALLKPRVMIVPLQDNLFNRCKSNIAAIHAVYAGAVPVVPDMDGWHCPGSSYYLDSVGFGMALNEAMGRDTYKSQERFDWLQSMSLEKMNEIRYKIVMEAIG